MTGGVFEPLSDEQDKWFSRLEQLDRVPETEAFEQLVTLQPNLREFEETVLRVAPDLWPSPLDSDDAIVSYVVDGSDRRDSLTASASPPSEWRFANNARPDKSQAAIPDWTQRSKISTLSGAHAPSHGIEPFFTRSKISEA